MNTGALILLSNLTSACPALVDVRIAVLPSHTPLGAWFLLTSLLAASATDLHRFRIPNWITYPTIAAGLGINTASDLIDQFRSDWLIDSFGLVSARDSVLGCLTGFAVMLLAYILTGRGAGDVKLAGAIGAFLGPNAALSVILWTHLIAGIFAIALCHPPRGSTQVVAIRNAMDRQLYRPL